MASDAKLLAKIISETQKCHDTPTAKACPHVYSPEILHRHWTIAHSAGGIRMTGVNASTLRREIASIGSTADARKASVTPR